MPGTQRRVRCRRTRTRAVLVVVCAALAVVGAASEAAPRSQPQSDTAYHPIRLSARPAQPPTNTAIGLTGSRLTTEARSIGTGNLGFEPMVGVDRDGTAFFNARIQIGVVAGKALNEQSMFRSGDAGRTWSDISGGPSQHWSSVDPYLYVDPDTGRVFWLDMVHGGATLSTSDDKGMTWSTNHIQALGENDHPTMTTAYPPRGSGLVPTDPRFPKVVYYCTQTVVSASCARSLDGGRSFLPISPPLLGMSTSGSCNGALTGHMAADRAGRIYVGSAACGAPWVSVSEDGGDTWRDVVVSKGINTPATINGDHDVNLAIDAAGTAYAVWTDDRDNLPYLSVSTTQGRSWQTPMMIAPPGATATSYATIDAGDAGRLALSLLATWGAPDDSSRPWQHLLVLSDDAAASVPTLVSRMTQLDARGTTIVGRGAGCCSAIKDFLSVVVAPTDGGRAWASLSVGCTGACARDPKGTSDNPNIGAPYVVRQAGGIALRSRSSGPR